MIPEIIVTNGNIFKGLPFDTLLKLHLKITNKIQEAARIIPLKKNPSSKYYNLHYHYVQSL